MKRSKHFVAKDAAAPKAAKVTSASPASKRKSPAKPASTSGAKTSSARKTAQKTASKARKTIVLDSDSGDGDDDFQASHAWALSHSAHNGMFSRPLPLSRKAIMLKQVRELYPELKSHLSRIVTLSMYMHLCWTTLPAHRGLFSQFRKAHNTCRLDKYYRPGV